MAANRDKRAHRRLAIRFPLECCLADDVHSPVYRTVTRDVSSGGVCFEMDAEPFDLGTRLVLDLVIPPGDGYFPTTGRIRGVGQVVRVRPLPNGDTPDPHPQRFGIAAHFDETLQLVF